MKGGYFSKTKTTKRKPSSTKKSSALKWEKDERKASSIFLKNEEKPTPRTPKRNAHEINPKGQATEHGTQTLKFTQLCSKRSYTANSIPRKNLKKENRIEKNRRKIIIKREKTKTHFRKNFRKTQKWSKFTCLCHQAPNYFLQTKPRPPNHYSPLLHSPCKMHQSIPAHTPLPTPSPPAPPSDLNWAWG